MIPAMSNPLSMPQVIDANGLRFGYHTLGTGPLVLLLHGFPDTAKAWEPVLGPVGAAGHKAVAVYLRGYTPSSIPAADTTIDDLAADVVALIEAFGGGPAVVVGHDWGAYAAYGAAALRPDLISQLVAVALPHPAGFKPKLTDLWSARHFATFRRKSAPRKFVADDFAGLREIVRRWSPNWDFAESDLADIKRCLSDPQSLQAIFGYYRALERKPNDLLRHRIDIPTVAIAGRTDGAVPLRAFDEAASRFNGMYYVIEMDTGHSPHRESPVEFTAHLLDALAE